MVCAQRVKLEEVWYNRVSSEDQLTNSYFVAHHVNGTARGVQQSEMCEIVCLAGLVVYW